MTSIYQKFKTIVSEKYISNNLYIRHAYSRNVDPILQGIPDYVIRPKNAHEISEILKVAYEENIPVYPRGGGCCEFGGSKPIGNEGIVLDMKRMEKIINFNEKNLIINVEAGATWAKVNDYLCKFGLYTGYLGPGSGLTASIGGGISNNSVGGGGSAKYGTCTNILVALQVVLPNGDIIETGSQANKYSEFPFIKSGNGPDLVGLFCGDNGIFGVKTEVSLRVFPRPTFTENKTFLLPRKDNEAAVNIFSQIREKGIDIFDAVFMPLVVVKVGCQNGLFPMWDHIKRKRGILFYNIEANSEEELKVKVKQLDDIFSINKAEPLGSEISEGNFAKWHYTKGVYNFSHNLWNVFPGMEALTAEGNCPIFKFPNILNDIETWDMEHEKDMRKILDITGIRPISGSGAITLIDGNNVGLSIGFTSFGKYWDGHIYEEIDEINLKLWKSLLERMIKHGVQYYMLGDIMSRYMVDIGAFHSQYYELMKSIKKIIDPKHILSRGKFNFWGDEKNE